MAEATTKPTRVMRHQLLNGRGDVVDDLLTMEQAAELIGVSKKRISQLVADGTLAKHPLNNLCYLLEKREVETYAASNRKPGRKPTAF